MQEQYELHWKDYYKILMLPKGCGDEQKIQSSYLNLMKTAHADASGEDRARDLDEAHACLKDAGRRAAYWRCYQQRALGSREERQSQPPPNDTAADDDIRRQAEETARAAAEEARLAQERRIKEGKEQAALHRKKITKIGALAASVCAVVLVGALVTNTLVQNANTGRPSVPLVNEGPKIMSPAEFGGRKISVRNFTDASDSLDEMAGAGAGINVYPHEMLSQCFDDLKLGRVDAVYAGSVAAAFYTRDNEAFERTWISGTTEPLGICLAKESTALAAAVEAALDTLFYTGEMKEIAMRHFGDDLTANLRTVTRKPVIPTQYRTIWPGTLTVGGEMGYPPMEYTAADGVTPIGFDIDVGKAVAGLLGLEWNFVATSWDGIFAGLETERYDCIISAVSITSRRQEQYILTGPYVASALCIVTNA